MRIDIYARIVVYRFYCMALFHSQTRRHVIINPLKCSSIELNQNDHDPGSRYVAIGKWVLPRLK